MGSTPSPAHPLATRMVGLWAPAQQASRVAMTTAASQLGKDRSSPSPPVPCPDAGTGSTPALSPSSGCRGQHPKPTAEHKVLFTLAPRCWSTLLIYTFLCTPLKAVRAGEAFAFHVRICPFKPLPSQAACAGAEADAQLAGLRAGPPPTSPCLLQLCSSARHNVHRLSPNPSCPPGGDRVGIWLPDCARHSLSHPSLQGSSLGPALPPAN